MVVVSKWIKQVSRMQLLVSLGSSWGFLEVHLRAMDISLVTSYTLNVENSIVQINCANQLSKSIVQISTSQFSIPSATPCSCCYWSCHVLSGEPVCPVCPV